MALQVSTVAAQNPCMKANLTGDAMTACLDKERNKSPGEGKMMDHSGMGDMAPMDDTATMGNAAQGFSGEQDVNLDSTAGGYNDASPIDPRSGQPFAESDLNKFEKYANECEATQGLLSEGSTQELVKEGFTRLQVEKLCKDGPEERHIANGPSEMR